MKSFQGVGAREPRGVFNRVKWKAKLPYVRSEYFQGYKTAKGQFSIQKMFVALTHTFPMSDIYFILSPCSLVQANVSLMSPAQWKLREQVEEGVCIPPPDERSSGLVTE